MKNLLFLLLFFTSCSTSESLPSGAIKVELMNTIKTFITEFEMAVLGQDKDKVMLMMHPTYINEQHDDFLQGKTNQFLKEFFGPSFNDISAFKRKYSYTIKANIFVVYEIVSKSNNNFTMHYKVGFRNDETDYDFGMWGAVG